MKWFGTDRTIQLRDIKIGRKGIILNDPTAAEHNTAIFEKLNRKMREFRLEIYETHKMGVVAPLVVELDCGHGLIYVNPPGVVFEYIGGLPKPYDYQNIVELRGTITLAYQQNPNWSGKTVLTIEGMRIEQSGIISVHGVGTPLSGMPKHGILFRQGFQDGSDKQPWGHFARLHANGHFEKSAVEVVSAEEISIEYLVAYSLREGVPALNISIDSDSRIKETSQTMTNFHVHYAHMETVSSPVVELNGFIGGQISLDAGVLHVRKVAETPHVRLNSGAHLRTLRYGMRHDRGPRPEANLTGIDARLGRIERLIDAGYTHHDKGAMFVGRIDNQNTTVK